MALRRRAVEGGSYLVRCSLAQTARLLVSLTRADPVALSALGDELPAAGARGRRGREEEKF